jgi:hypothetical protein
MQTAGDHEMQDDEQVVVEPEDDALSGSADVSNALVNDLAERRLDGSEQKRGSQAHLEELLADEPALERLDVDRNVR